MNSFISLRRIYGMQTLSDPMVSTRNHILDICPMNEVHNLKRMTDMQII